MPTAKPSSSATAIRILAALRDFIGNRLSNIVGVNAGMLENLHDGRIGKLLDKPV